jgi:hypothetical protein
MENLILDKNILTDKGESFCLTVYSEPSTIATEQITIAFRVVNGEKIHYLYQTEKSSENEDRYIDAIKEAVNDFRQNKALENLIQF